MATIESAAASAYKTVTTTETRHWAIGLDPKSPIADLIARARDGSVIRPATPGRYSWGGVVGDWLTATVEAVIARGLIERVGDGPLVARLTPEGRRAHLFITGGLNLTRAEIADLRRLTRGRASRSKGADL